MVNSKPFLDISMISNLMSPSPLAPSREPFLPRSFCPNGNARYTHPFIIHNSSFIIPPP